MGRLDGAGDAPRLLWAG